MIILASFLSGAAGLVFEVLWAKRLGLLFGSAAVAQASVLAAFLGGLALGGALLGRRADAAPSPLRFYAKLEALIALAGLLAPLLLGVADGGWRWLGPLGVLGHAFLMGGATPALARALGGETQKSVGRLYAANAAGAALGCLAAAFYVIPSFGLVRGFATGAALNVLAALAALASRASAPLPLAPARDERETFPGARRAAAVVFVSGAAALVYETAWTRLLALVLGSSVYSFAEMLAALIAGLAVGGALAATKAARRRDPALLLGLAAGGTALAVLAGLPLCPRLPHLFVKLRGHFGSSDASFHAFEAAKFSVCALLLLAPAVGLGMTVPLAARLAAGERDAGGERVGRVLAANALGNATGVALGLWLLPRLGLENALRAAAAVHLLLGAVLLRRTRPATAAVLAAALAVCAFAPRWDARMFARGTFRKKTATEADFAAFRAKQTDFRQLFHRDDREATVDVLAGDPGYVSLLVNGKADASTGTDLATQILVGSLPLLLKPGSSDMLIIGWGSGMSAGAALRHPVARVDAVELIPAVVEGSRHFDHVSGLPLSDPRLALSIEDAKTFLARPGPLYDVVASEPSNPWMAGVADLFSVEFYARAKARLKPGGLFLQWFHLYEMDDAGFALVLRTLRSSFPYVTIWRVPFTRDALLVGTDAPLEPAPDSLERAFLRPEVWRDLARANIGAPTTLLSLQTASEETSAALAGRGPVNTELRPLLEYAAPKAFFRHDDVKALSAADDRDDPFKSGRLLLAKHLAARGRPLSLAELRDWASLYHSPEEKAGVERVLADWTRRRPGDPDAAAARRLIRRSWGLD